MVTKKAAPPQTLYAEGNNGGSFIEVDIADAKKGVLHLRVGDTCVMAFDGEISVVALAMLIRRAVQGDIRAALANEFDNGIIPAWAEPIPQYSSSRPRRNAG